MLLVLLADPPIKKYANLCLNGLRLSVDHAARRPGAGPWSGQPKKKTNNDMVTTGIQRRGDSIIKRLPVPPLFIRRNLEESRGRGLVVTSRAEQRENPDRGADGTEQENHTADASAAQE